MLINFGNHGIQSSIVMFFLVDSKNSQHALQPTAGFKRKTSLIYFDKFINMQDGPTIVASLSMFVLILIVLQIILSKDVHPLPGPVTDISIVHNNIRSLQNKVSLVEAELSSYDIITLSETWLHGNYPEGKLTIKGFSDPYRCDRPTNNNLGSGGVLIYAKNKIFTKGGKTSRSKI